MQIHTEFQTVHAVVRSGLSTADEQPEQATRLGPAYKARINEPVVNVVMGQMFRRESHIDMITVELRYPRPEEGQISLDIVA